MIMNKKDVEKLIDQKLSEFRSFIDMFMDIPVLAADINNDAKEIVEAIKQSDIQLEIVKKKQVRIENSLKEMKRLNSKLQAKSFLK